MSSGLPDGLISYGPQANCTLELCPLAASVYGYKPSLAASWSYIFLFAISMTIHIVQSIRYKSWGWMVTMSFGCIDEITGYIGRIMLHTNPFGFFGFLINIVCITIGPVFFSAAIYVLLARITMHLGQHLSRLPPKAYYFIFIPCDIVSLIAQAIGGASSATAKASNKTGVYISEAGLGFQVFTLLIFMGLCVDFAMRYRQAPANLKTPLDRRFRVFAIFLALAVLFIFIRCVYRIAELSKGYSGPLIRHQGEFYVFESTMITFAVFCLNVAHPGPVFNPQEQTHEKLDDEKMGTAEDDEYDFRDWMG